MIRTHRFSSDVAQPVARPGCKGLRAAPVARAEAWDVTALYLEPNAYSDDHAAPHDQWLTVLRGRGWASLGDERQPLRAGDALLLPKDVFHSLATEKEEMAALAFTPHIEPGPELARVSDRAALAHNAAQRFVAAAREAIAARGRFSAVLSGGSTPRDLYALLAQPEFARQVDWERVHLFWGDERAVPPDHPDSNYRMAREQLGEPPIPANQVHRMPAEQAPEQAAFAYEQTLREFRIEGEALSVFDLVLLGLGEDGHTASLFPHSPALAETTRWVVAHYVEKLGAVRITLTAPVLNAAKHILFLVAGAEKAQTVRAVLRGQHRPDDLPAQMIQPAVGRVVWLLDRAAASAL